MLNRLFNLYADKKKTILQDQENVVTDAESLKVCLKIHDYILWSHPQINKELLYVIIVLVSNIKI